MENHIISKCGISYLGVIWSEVINHEEYLKESGQRNCRPVLSVSEEDD